MEQRRGADARGLTLEIGAAGELDVFALLDRGEMPIDQARVGEGPEMLGRLQLWGVGGQEEQMDMLGHPQAHPGRFPAGTVKDQDDLFVRASADLPGELGQLHRKERDTDTRGEMEQGPSEQRPDGRTPPGSVRRSGGAPGRGAAGQSAPTRVGAAA
jgi:hypothetical protein